MIGWMELIFVPNDVVTLPSRIAVVPGISVVVGKMGHS